MGFFSKLFGKGEEKKQEIPVDLPIRTAELKGSAFLELADLAAHGEECRRKWRQLSLEKVLDEDYENSRLDVEYKAELEYVVLDEELLIEGIGEDDVDTALNEVFYVVIAEHNSIKVKAFAGDTEEYEEFLLKELNFAISDWGLKGKSFKLKSIAPTENYREFFEEFKETWE